MSEVPRAIAFQYIRNIEGGVVHPKEKVHYGQISGMRGQYDLEIGDVVRVHLEGSIPLVLVVEILEQVPENADIPGELTILKRVRHPENILKWPKKRKKKNTVPKQPKQPKQPKHQKQTVSPDVHDLRTFSNRFRFALEHKKMGYQEFSELIGTKKNRIKKFADGHVRPSPQHIREMARVLDVPPKWLAGKPDKPLSFGDRLRQTMIEKKVSKRQLAYETKIPHGNIVPLITGKIFPTMDELSKIAKYLDVSAPWLAGNR